MDINMGLTNRKPQLTFVFVLQGRDNETSAVDQN
jgi:hypothetical protein